MQQDIFATFDDKADISFITGTLGTGATGSFPSSNSYDCGIPGVPVPVGVSNLAFGGAAGSGTGTIGGPLLHDIGRGRRVSIVVQVLTAFTSGGAGTLQVNIINTTDAALTAGLQVLLSTQTAIALATLVAGFRMAFGSVPGKVPKRFLGLQYVVATAAFTGGLVSSFLALDVDEHGDIMGA